MLTSAWKLQAAFALLVCFLGARTANPGCVTTVWVDCRFKVSFQAVLLRGHLRAALRRSLHHADAEAEYNSTRAWHATNSASELPLLRAPPDNIDLSRSTIKLTRGERSSSLSAQLAL